MSTDMETYINDVKVITQSPVNGKVIKLLKCMMNVSDVTLHVDVDSVPVKITTDFNKYCLGETVLDIINLNDFNMSMVFKKKDPKTIFNEISKTNEQHKIISSKSTTDPFHIYQKIEEYTKFPLNYSDLEKEFVKSTNINKTQNNSKIPRELLLSPTQIIQLIINEVKKVNRNKNYNHYVIPDPNDPSSLTIRIKFNPSTDADILFQKINKTCGYDYMEMKLQLDPKAHPFMPPKLEYIKPKIKLPLLLSLINIDILKLENWNPTITLEYLITNLSTQLEPIVTEYIHDILEVDYNDFEYAVTKLIALTKECAIDKQLVKIGVPRQVTTAVQTSPWKSGTGYGTDTTKMKKWDIKMYIKEQELQNEEITNCLRKINSMIPDASSVSIKESVLITYLINQLKGMNMLELEKNIDMFCQIFNILANLIGKSLEQTTINNIADALKCVYDDLDTLFKSSPQSLKNGLLLQTYCTSNWYVEQYKLVDIPIQVQSTSNISHMEEYCQVMKPLQFGSYELPHDHRYIKHSSVKPDQKALIRILSEISSFKTGLPLNWGSSIWVRVPKNNINLFSFLISGPKDTPYENGLFEFHAYLPPDYPTSIPQVLIHTTGNGTVRFNPNLYDTGKVCLSLLGTWSGQDGETWNPKTSTFLQVMVSIQSLILVEDPYFNEPGYERNMNTDAGKQKSTEYNKDRLHHTIKLAMSNMIANPPNGFEDVVRNHFRLKKEEILTTTQNWVTQSKKYTALLTQNRQELIELLSTL
jgi:ubiquitin-protein ligase